jgi:hypothetical protein
MEQPSLTAIRKAASDWAEQDRPAAAEWAITQAPESIQVNLLAAIVGNWMSEDRAAVENWLAQFPPGKARDRSVSAYLWGSLRRLQTDPQTFADFEPWFDLISDPWERTNLALPVFQFRSRRDPAEARAWLASLKNVDPEVVRQTLRDAAK